MKKYKEHWASYETAKELGELLNSLNVDLLCAINTADDCIPDADGWCACGITEAEIKENFLEVKKSLLEARKALMNAEIKLTKVKANESEFLVSFMPR